ncbi:MAG: carbon-nitrogen hydrolase [Microbacteriaceae bacterium]|nr:carbon-nitrogen hydrolase [Microbacteriaceae bacterium]
MLRMAVLQAVARINAVAENLESVALFAQRAASEGADLLVTPELFATGYAPGLVKHSDGESIRAELARIARKQGIALVGSSVEVAGSDLHICASLFDDQGSELTRYRKAHLFGPDEKAAFAPGNALPELVPYRGLTLALGLCYDIEFPEYARSAAVRGADLLCIPTAVPTTGDVGGATPGLSYNAERISTMMVPVRALENGVYIAYANHTAPGFTGLSSIVSPYGTFLDTAGGGEQLLIAEIDEAEVRRARKINTYLDCVRTDLCA